MTAASSGESMPQTRSQNVRRWVVLAVVAAVSPLMLVKGCNYFSDIAHRDDVARKFGGSEIVDAIQEPDRVTAQRMREIDPFQQTCDGGFSRVDYEEMGQPVDVSESDARRLARWLTSGSSYVWNDASVKSCSPSYGVKLVFERDQQVEVWLCFECDIFTVFLPGDEDHARGAHGSDFELIHDELADIMRDLFPDDEAIQQL